MTTKTATTSITKSTKQYLAMMLLSFFAGPTGLARVYRGDRGLGWSIFWTFIGSLVFILLGIILPPLIIVATAILVGLSVWATVDFFFLYNKKTDSENRMLLTSDYDKKVVKVLFIVFIVLQSLNLLSTLIGMLVLFFVLISSLSNSYQTFYGDDMPMYDSPRSSQLFNSSDIAAIEMDMSKDEVESILHGASGNCRGGITYEVCTYHSGMNINRSRVSITYTDGLVSDLNEF